MGAAACRRVRGGRDLAAAEADDTRRSAFVREDRDPGLPPAAAARRAPRSVPRPGDDTDLVAAGARLRAAQHDRLEAARFLGSYYRILRRVQRFCARSMEHWS